MKTRIPWHLTTGLLAVAIFVANAAGADIELSLSVQLDLTGRNPPAEIQASRFYEAYDRDFEDGGIAGRIQLEALRTSDGSQDRVLDASPEAWTRHLSSRLFRDGVELEPEDYDVRFESETMTGQSNGAAVGRMIVQKGKPLEATFRLSGPNGTPLRPGTYRFWILFDMRTLPVTHGAFRGLAVNDAGAYYLHGDSDPAKKGGLVFAVDWIGSNAGLQARYLAQQAVLEESKAMALEALPNGTLEKGVAHRRKAVENALLGLSSAPGDPELLVILIRNYSVLNRCEDAVPYIWQVEGIDSSLLRNGFENNMRMRQCVGYADELRYKQKHP